MTLKKINNKLYTLTNKLTNWIGTTQSILAHSLLFAGSFALRLAGVELESILLVLTTAVSLEAIYLAIFIQMSVNRSNESIAEIEEDVKEINENVDEMQEDVELINVEYVKDSSNQLQHSHSNDRLILELNNRVIELNQSLKNLQKRIDQNYTSYHKDSKYDYFQNNIYVQ